MLKLSFYQAATAIPSVTLDLTDLRATGATLWNPMDRGLIAIYTHGAWKHEGRRYHKLAVTGGACLLFGITRDPTLVSAPIERFYFTGPTLSANGASIAKYMEHQDMWQGTVRPMWWNAMRIISVDTLSAAVDQTQVEQLNPWEPHPMQIASFERPLRH
jgi:hypothetical protein